MSPTEILSQIPIFLCLYFEVFLLISFFDYKKDKDGKLPESTENYPTVTITVPVFNEERTVSRTIDSILSLDYPKNKLEIFIVDDGSTDNTWSFVQKFKDNPQIKLFKKENGGKFTVLNYAIEHSKSDLLGCLDADSFVKQDALKIIVSHFMKDKDIMAVTPSVKIYQPNNFIRHIQSNEYDLGVFRKEIQSRLGAIYVTPGPFSFYKKEVFKTIGVFKHAHMTEDMEIAMRMQKNHLKIENAYDAIVYTVGPDTIKKLHKQRVRWIYGFIKNSIDYKEFFFNKKYKHLGMFFMPLSAITIFLSLFYFFKTLFKIIHYIFVKILEFSFSGLNIHFKSMKLDWFFINTEAISFIGALLLGLTIIIIIYGKYMTDKKIKVTLYTLFFPIIYPLLSIFWLLKSVYNVILLKKTHWR